MHITSNISNRYAKTLIESKLKNEDKVAKETYFAVILPNKAFITEFVMEIGGRSYKAYIREKRQANIIYAQVSLSFVW